jgi:hypothetical protein
MSTELFTEQIIMLQSTCEKGEAKSTTENDTTLENFGSTFLKGCKGIFGVLTLKAALSSMTTKQLELFFQIDCSGSMNDMCADSRSKMQHILHTLKNMIYFLKENPGLNVQITIHAFDDKIYKIVDRTPVNEDTCDKIIAAIQTIRPRDSTNIETALNDVNDYFSSLQADCEKVSIFMTDGQATSGNQIHSYLSSCVNDSITNIFIGFGLDHDSRLLKTISSGEKSSYYFIDKLENAGLVYGEILHGLVYKYMENVTISVTNGLIYDYKKNTWTSSLYVGNIVSEANKFYQLKSDNPSDCVVQVSGNKVSDDSEFVTIVPVQEEPADLTIYMYRQRTQELLFKVNDFNSNEESNVKDYLEKQSEKKALRKELHDFFEELKKYMADNQLKENIMLKNLCDDIYICYRTFGTTYGFMYCAARECSQGQQRAYTATQLPDVDDESIFNLRIQRQTGICRSNAITDIEYEDEEDTTGIQHNLSAATQTPYRTPTMTGVMRSCSAGINVDLEEAEQTQEM